MANLILIVVFALVFYLDWFKITKDRWPWGDHVIKLTGGEGE